MLLAEFYDEGWNRDLLKCWLLIHLVPQVQQIHLFLDQVDYTVWLESSTGEFFVKSAWETIHQKRNKLVVDKFIWNDIVPLKTSFFVWKVLRNVIPLDSVL